MNEHAHPHRPHRPNYSLQPLQRLQRPQHLRPLQSPRHVQLKVQEAARRKALISAQAENDGLRQEVEAAREKLESELEEKQRIEAEEAK